MQRIRQMERLKYLLFAVKFGVHSCSAQCLHCSALAVLCVVRGRGFHLASLD